MPWQYRALISVPITANNDAAAQHAADEMALNGDGHVELIGETADDSLRIIRVVRADPHFAHQLPYDWKA
jgi:hypothetical protein